MNVPFTSLLLSLVALAWGYINHRRAQEAAIRLENTRSSHFRLADQMRGQVEQLHGEVRQLRTQLRALQNGGALYHDSMTVGEAVALDPRVGTLLESLHIGGCSSCAVSPTDTLRQAAEGNGQDVEKVLAALNKLAAVDGDDMTRMLDRRPNVQISL